MEDFLEIVRGDGLVSDAGALRAFEILVPLLEGEPEDEEALQAARDTLLRMDPEGALAPILDWWLVVTTKAPSPLGLAHRLPDHLPMPLRSAMESLVEVAGSSPPVTAARWAIAHRELADGVARLDRVLDLDSYGKSKLPNEREVWAWLTDQVADVVNALRTGRQTSFFTLDERAYEKEMKRLDIAESSRRWKEMLKRARECTSRINAVVELQRQVEPWVARGEPLAVDDLGGLSVELGRIRPAVFRAVLVTPIDSSKVGDEDVHFVADRLHEIAAGCGERDLVWLASIADGWVARTGVEVPSLAGTIDRCNQLRDAIERLRGAGEDADDIELTFLDHDLEGAERLLAEVEMRRKQERQGAALTSRLDQLRKSLPTDAPGDESWAERLGQIQSLLDERQYESASRQLTELDRDLRRSRRSHSLAELESLILELDGLDGPVGLVNDARDYLRLLADDPDRTVDEARIEQIRERVESLTRQRRREVEDWISLAHDQLESERDLINPERLPDLEFQLLEAQTALDDGELMAAHELSTLLLAEIEQQRVHRWTAAEGEAALVRHVIDYCTQEIHFQPDDVRRLYVAAKTKPFVILAGLTGSGKSTIARLFAAALGADASNGRFRRVAVRPDWIDQSEVLGVINPLSNRFEPGWLAEVARECERHLDLLHVVLLDEMNLAPVEQYLAEFLSGLEEHRSGAASTTIPLYSPGATPSNADEWPPAVPFPPNLIVIGTVNVDETTRVLSERVLDRANVLQLSVAVSDAHHNRQARSVQPWSVPFREWDQVCVGVPDDDHHDFLVEVAEVLQGVGIGVGQRAHIELERFVANASGVIDPVASLDLGVLQRIVPKIRGFKRDLVSGLSDLQELFDSTGCVRSSRVIERWLRDEVSDDEFLDGTDARLGLLL